MGRTSSSIEDSGKRRVGKCDWPGCDARPVVVVGQRRLCLDHYIQHVAGRRQPPA